ncbi:MAG: response regulator transcription factor [Gammaproteobacteria bacterium]|nr:response regulator transcription factor [Gammaproteobacteria bacterium]MDH3466684.1 response regulator transcription factor [Gammaproteobacteria bacterium]
MTEKIRVLIADDHAMFREGVRLLLKGEPDLEVVGDVANGNEIIVVAEAVKPHVVLMDISMPGMNGLEATKLLKNRLPDTHVLVLTMHHSEEYFIEMLKLGASGYVLKASDTEQLVDAIREVARGGIFVHPDMASEVLQDYARRLRSEREFGRTPPSHREKQILGLLAEGYSNKEIAGRLHVSPSTIHSHRTNLMRKLDIKTQHELIRYARRYSPLDEV